MPSAFVSDAACSVASPSTYRSGRMRPASIDREVSRISSWLPDHRIISDDNGCARFHFISELVREIGTEAQSRGQSLGIHRAPFAGHPHPSRLFVFRGESARLSSSSFEHREYVVTETITAG